MLNAKVGPNIAATEKFFHSVSKAEIENKKETITKWEFISAENHRFVRAIITLKHDVEQVIRFDYLF